MRAVSKVFCRRNRLIARGRSERRVGAEDIGWMLERVPGRAVGAWVGATSQLRVQTLSACARVQEIERGSDTSAQARKRVSMVERSSAAIPAGGGEHCSASCLVLAVMQRCSERGGAGPWSCAEVPHYTAPCSTASGSGVCAERGKLTSRTCSRQAACFMSVLPMDKARKVRRPQAIAGRSGFSGALEFLSDGQFRRKGLVP